MSSAHAKFSPSSYYRWSTCSGYFNLKAKHPEIRDVSSAYAAEGTRLHTVADNYLKTGAALGPDSDKLRDYVEYCRGLPGKMLTEQRLSLEQVWPEFWGTADCVVYDAAGSTLHVIDLKTGAGVPVEVIGNEQLKIYALGALLSFPAFSATRVVATIVQSSCYHPDGPIRSETYESVTLIDFWEDTYAAAKRTTDPDALLNPGAGCKWCDLSGVCPAIGKRATALAQQVFKPIQSAQDLPALEKLAYTLTQIPVLESFIEGVRKAAYQAACRGIKVPGYKLVEKRSHRKWDHDETVTADMLEKQFGIAPDESYERSFKSPAQIEKMVDSKDKKRLAALIKTESTGSSLVRESDPRAEVIVTTAQEVFEPIENGEN